MADWRLRLKEMLSRTARPQRGLGVEEARRAIEEFIENTVLPAFEELRVELESLGREVDIERGQHHAGLTVLREGKEEFSFAVRGRAYHKLSFAFPEMGKDNEPRICKAEVVLSGGRTHGHEVHTYSKEAIIQEFLDEYGKWMGWTMQEKPPKA